MTKKILLSKDKYALVDDEDYLWLNEYKWCCNGQGYAMRGKWNKMKKVNDHFIMHREILHAPDGIEVDHINGNRLDNRKENLRLSTKVENGRNRGLNSNNSSGYKGVSYKKSRHNWQARINVKGKRIWLGQGNSPEEAARIYDIGALKYFGEFAWTNFPKENYI